MNSNGRNSRLLNSILPTKTNTPTTVFTNTGMKPSMMNTMGSYFSYVTLGYIFILAILITASVLMYYYRVEIKAGWDTSVDLIKSYFEKTPPPPPPPPPPVPASVPAPTPQKENHESDVNILEKVLPAGGQEVFNISSNKYTYYDADPLCASLGAELATYDQVKEAWSKGADWCNYGWVKGQMAVYPTSADTFKKTQSGPEDGRSSCGQIGVNGGYFDNPELKYGVTCYGKKPPQTSNSSADVTKNTPTSPDAIAYQQKVKEFKANSDNIGILPFNGKSWSS